MSRSIVALAAAGALIAAVAACSGSSGGSPAPATGQSCSQAAQCYSGVVDQTAIHGTVTCLTALQGGYCTHTCQTDQDCCAATGECPSGVPEVCAPLESTGMTYCFVSCEAAALPASDGGVGSADAYCHEWAGDAFTCRSTGGGSANKHFCGP